VTGASSKSKTSKKPRDMIPNPLDENRNARNSEI
jgi:hypothetical protein